MHSHSDSCYKVIKTITAKYGADIHGNFPIKDGNDTIWWSVPERMSNPSSRVHNLGSIDTMPGENITFDFRRRGFWREVLWYYVETLEWRKRVTYQQGGKSFNLYKKIDHRCNTRTSLTYTEEFHNITGFTQWWF